MKEYRNHNKDKSDFFFVFLSFFCCTISSQLKRGTIFQILLSLAIRPTINATLTL